MRNHEAHNQYQSPVDPLFLVANRWVDGDSERARELTGELNRVIATLRAIDNELPNIDDARLASALYIMSAKQRIDAIIHGQDD